MALFSRLHSSNGPQNKALKLIIIENDTWDQVVIDFLIQIGGGVVMGESDRPRLHNTFETSKEHADRGGGNYSSFCMGSLGSYRRKSPN